MFLSNCSGDLTKQKGSVIVVWFNINKLHEYYCRKIFVCFVALRPKSTAMVMAGRSIHLPTLFLGKLEQAVNQYFVHILSLVTDNNTS